MDIKLRDEVIKCLKENDFIYDIHFNEQQVARNLQNVDEVKALLEGDVIEFMYKENNGEKYVVYAKQGEKIVHIVIMYYEGTLLLKTIYEPNKEKKVFSTDLRTRLNSKILRITEIEK